MATRFDGITDDGVIGTSTVMLDFADGDDFGVVQRGGRLGFLQEAAAVGIGESLLRQHLERHGTVQPGVPGLVDHPHAAFAEPFHDFKMRNGLANHVVRPETGRVLV